MVESRWNGSDQPAVVAKDAHSFCLEAVGPLVDSAMMSLASSILQASGSCAAAMAASADPLPYGLGSPEPLSRGPPPGVHGAVTDAAEAGLSTMDRVGGVMAKPSCKSVALWRTGNGAPGCDANDRLNGMLQRRVSGYDRSLPIRITEGSG